MRKRILYSNNGAINDWSINLNNYYSGEESATLIASTDAIYIGSLLPFNHIYFKMGSVPNVETSEMKVQYWSRNEFRDVVELLDETDTNGASLSKDGYITWTPNKDDRWDVDDTDDISELDSVLIYDLYWLKITFTNDLTVATAMSWIGYLFSNDYELGSEFPDIVASNFKNAIEDGKTSYEEQAKVGADIMIKDLIQRRVIRDPSQILTREDLVLPSVQKVAELVFNILGDDYENNKMDARKEYDVRLSRAFVKTDKNNNAILDPKEQIAFTGKLIR